MKARATSILLAGLIAFAPPLFGAEKVKIPTVVEAPDGSGRMLLIPDDVRTFLENEFPNFRLPKETDFNEEMRRYYFSRLIGVHPAVAWGDFNKDKKRDYAFLVITGDTPWGPLCELVIANGKGRTFEAHRLGEVYQFKSDYVSFKDGKLYKGRFKKGGWHINWDARKKTYVALKS